VIPAIALTEISVLCVYTLEKQSINISRKIDLLIAFVFYLVSRE
jgi:hypothetical protein